MESNGLVLLIFAVIWMSFGLLGLWVSTQKHRNPFEGFILGFVFGPLGVLIAALVPSVSPDELRRQAQEKFEQGRREREYSEKLVKQAELAEVKRREANGTKLRIS